MSQINRFTPVAGPGSGTVTSISAGTGITLTPNPITTTGTVALTIPVTIADGGTNATSFTNTDGVVYFDGTRLVDTAVGTAGQVLTSNGAGLAPTFQAISASSISLTGNTGGALTGNAFTIDTANSTPIFAGSGTTLTLDFALTNNLLLGSPGASITSANDTTALGKLAAAAISSGQENTFIGYESGVHYTTGSNSTAIGAFSMFSAIGGASNNTTLGYSSLYNLAGIGTGNISIGSNSSTAYTTTESNNIIVGNIGVIADSGKIRIGTNGTHTATYIAGIDGVNVGSVAKVVTLASDQLGTATLTAGTNIVITPGANTITIAADTGSASFNYTAVSSSPYVVLTTDYYLGVDCSGGAIQINLPNLPATGRVFVVKDKTGSAATHNITVTTVGGLVNIDGAATFVMNTAYESIQLMFNGSTYEVW